MAATVTVAKKSIIIKPPDIGDARQIDAWNFDVASIIRHLIRGRVVTSGGAFTTIIQLSLPTNSVAHIGGWALGRRLSGVGSLNDGFAGMFRTVFKNVAGTVNSVIVVGNDPRYQSGATGLDSFDRKDDANMATQFVVLNNKITYQVRGVAGMDMAWGVFLKFVYIGFND